MNEVELRQMYACDDVFVMLYLFPAERLITECGIDGETAVRLGVRHFGVDRGSPIEIVS